jgi:pimeloyl-ACP methyl ester carboxylesterase
MPRRNRAITVVAILLSLLTSVACIGASADPPEGSKHVTIDTPDGETLDAVEMGSGSDVVIMSHGATGTMEGFYPLIAPMVEDGWRVIDYDARGVGDSTGGPEDDRTTDLRAAVTYARDTGAETIVLIGASLGASLSIAMAKDLDADGLISLSAPAEAANATEAAAGLRDTIPLMFAAAEGNEPYATDAGTLAEAAGVDAVIVEGSGHGTGMFGDNPDLIDEIVALADEARSSS